MSGQERQQQNEATVWTTAVRQRVAELRRHPGHDGPTVCACVECVLAHLLNDALNEVEFWHKEANGERRAHDKTAARLSGLQDTLANERKKCHVENLEHAIALAESDELYAEILRPYFKRIAALALTGDGASDTTEEAT